MERTFHPRVRAETKLARARLAAKLRQRDMSEATGISRSTYWRLERGRIPNPPLRYLTNCALVLGVPVEELIEDEWKETWFQLDPNAPTAPPDLGELQRRSHERAGWPVAPRSGRD